VLQGGLHGGYLVAAIAIAENAKKNKHFKRYSLMRSQFFKQKIHSPIKTKSKMRTARCMIEPTINDDPKV
jgi:hypothetical protein